MTRFAFGAMVRKAFMFASSGCRPRASLASAGSSIEDKRDMAEAIGGLAEEGAAGVDEGFMGRVTEAKSKGCVEEMLENLTDAVFTSLRL